MVEKKVFNEVVIKCSRLENRCANLELKLQHQKESFLNNRPLNNKDAPEIPEIFKINEWQAKLNAKDVSIAKLKKHIENLKGKNVVEKDLPLNNNKDYIKHSREHADTLREIVEHARALRPLDSDLDSACKWKPTGRTFTVDGNTCPLTRITSTKVVPLKETTSKSVTTQNPEIKVYSRRPKVTKSVGSSSKSKIVESRIVESRISNNSEPNQSWGSNASDVPSSSLFNFRFGNDQIAKIMGYGDYQMGNVMISRVYYVEGLEGVDLLKGSRGSNLYTLSLEDMMLSIPICLLSKALKTKSWLWHRRLMRIQIINGQKYILVIVDDYSRFTWVKFLRSKDEVPEFVIKFLKMIQVRLNAIVQNIRADNGTEKPDLSYLHVFGALCYPTNDSEDLAAHLDNDPFFGVPIPKPNSKESSSMDVIPTNMHSVNQPPEHLRK
ncbi:retrovirus-related pol polyprotein from transposon TNT 1-94 [Tanacetum coccineum]